MGLSTIGITPAYRILANGGDITSTIAARFVSLVLTDETGDNADTMELTLADHDNAAPITIPPTGGEVEVFIGYDAVATRKGLFIFDEVTLSGDPGLMVLHARAAPFAATPAGKTDMQTQKSRIWKDGTTLGALVDKVATEHGMSAAVSSSLQSVVLPHTTQDGESDINLLLRLAKRYDATVKPAGGVIVFAKRGEAQTMSGAALPSFTVDRTDCLPAGGWSMTKNIRGTVGTVVATYHDHETGERHVVQVGSSDPVHQIRFGFKNAAEALAAAQGQMTKRLRAGTRLHLSLPGHPEFLAEATLTLTGFRTGVPTDWIITSVRDSIDPGGAYTTNIEAELPNDATADAEESDTETDNPDAMGG